MHIIWFKRWRLRKLQKSLMETEARRQALQESAKQPGVDINLLLQFVGPAVQQIKGEEAILKAKIGKLQSTL